eukprot:CAMPEP_0119555448 /NCGR_PEP_ID=MMETSP1352-20130426/7656_1 /TAXON_ID=265584 /ORGANISM="Stauroneis constricta, Strain CCMP1120" /LENGTH=452 /DNA_ID=CAMNT_0007602209 /DNA_START=118 /DNA_END=1476 /DNA_ORIENTATION=+
MPIPRPPLAAMLLPIAVLMTMRVDAFSRPAGAVRLGSVAAAQHPFRPASWPRGHSALLSSAIKSSDEMRHDIDQMKKEALRRLDALGQQVSEYHAVHDHDHGRGHDEVADAIIGILESTSPKDRGHRQVGESEAVVAAPGTNPRATHHAMSASAPKRPPSRTGGDAVAKTAAAPAAASNRLDRLSNTRWRLSLDVGREEGTWMPKTWGASGERLRMSVEMEFSDQPLMEWEDFLNGSKDSKTLKVVNNCLSTAPSMNEGSLTVGVKDGGWRVACGEGPCGTDLLRFYFDVEDEARHIGSDVYCPEGRIFFTCGYFPLKHDVDDGPGFAPSPQVSMKEKVREQQTKLALEYEQMSAELEEDAPIWKKIQRSKRLMDMRGEASKLERRFQEARTREPERALLRLSQDRELGLTREGGACCKVHKGLAIEYHILGHFEVASIPNRDHSTYKELLP